VSDFFGDGWSLYIAIVTIAGLVGCFALLLVAARRRTMSEDNTTGHVWDDDLRELNNPLPRWWMWLFVLTIVFGGGYLWLYPGLGSAPGSKGWTSVGEYEADRAQAKTDAAPIYAAFRETPTQQLAVDSRAMAIGERLFANNCAACHGADAHGSRGFPNLTDRDWLHGGSPEQIEETITNGRIGQMPPMAAAVGTVDDVSNLAAYVWGLSEPAAVGRTSAQLGRSKFVVCAACHGADGKGNQAIGAPNLTDHVWLHGRGEAAIIAMINNGKTNVMPAQKDKMSPEQIHVLVAYVWSLSNAPVTASR
jgi:cytochrome c oxidase cbb3-type subunit 3